MSLLSRKNEEKPDGEDAAFAELERLRALAPDELALEVLPALGPDGPRGVMGVPDICTWLMRSHPAGRKASPGHLMAIVPEGLQRLEHANLVRWTQAEGGSVWMLTRLGEQALSRGTAARHLQPPVASAQA